jgi:hypothetical protein
MIHTATYVDKFERALSYEKIDYTGVLLWTFGAMVAILLLFLIAKIVKKIVESNVRHIEYFGIDFINVEKMHKQHLISDQEFRNIKASLSKQILEQTKSEGEKPKADLKSIVAQELGKRDAPRPSAEPPQTTAPAKEKSLSIKDMHDAGLISDEEFRELSSFFEPEDRR